MNSFWTSPTFNLLSILVTIIAIVFIGLKYGLVCTKGKHVGKEMIVGAFFRITDLGYREV